MLLSDNGGDMTGVGRSTTGFASVEPATAADGTVFSGLFPPAFPAPLPLVPLVSAPTSSKLWSSASSARARSRR
ncbi:MAG TPA: hypothetical protein DCY82_12060, partial [Acidimicrobiaceae bacterium]|nr:hypothetical protein [Acidimicrobiaceae bacterium]